MKKLLALLLALLLCLAQMNFALAETADEDLPVDGDIGETEEINADDEVDAQIDEADEWLYPEDEEDAVDDDELTEEELIALFGEDDDGSPLTIVNEDQQNDLIGAMEVYGWVALGSLDYDEELPSPDGSMWRVLDDKFNTPQLLKGMLSSYFSDEIVTNLWNAQTNPYVEIDGYLYTAGEGRNIDDNIDETAIEIMEATDALIKLLVTVSYFEPVDGVESEDFNYERKLIDGEWKYTLFPFFW